MNIKKKNTDMLHGPLLRKLLAFTLPVALCSIVQQLFNAADTAVAGYWGNGSALAAVGTNTETIALIVTFSSGLSIGVNILTAKLIGLGKRNEIPAAVKTAVVLSLLIGIAGGLIGQLTAAPLLRLIGTPENIFSDAVLYLQVYMLGYPFLMLYDFGSAILRANGDSRYPFISLLISGTSNIGLNLFLVIALHMGVAGVAAATDIANLISAMLVIHRLRKDPQYNLKLGKLKISAKYIGIILKNGISSAIQGAVFCVANIFVQAAINSFGDTAIAGSTIAMNYEYFTYYIITSFSQTATTFTSQNHAAGQYSRCRKILLMCLGLSAVCSAIPIYTIVIFRDFFAGLFSPEPEVISFAVQRIICILMFEPLCIFYEIPSGYLRGMGRSVYPAFSAICGTCIFRIIWIFTVFRAEHSLAVLYRSFPISWVLTSLLIFLGGMLIYLHESKQRCKKR